jgi:hypothetical protein
MDNKNPAHFAKKPLPAFAVEYFLQQMIYPTNRRGTNRLAKNNRAAAYSTKKLYLRRKINLGYKEQIQYCITAIENG